MSPRVQQLFAQTRDLTPAERAELAVLLIDENQGEPEPGHAEAWAAEIKRRVQELDDGIDDSIPWSELRQMMLHDEIDHGN